MNSKQDDQASRSCLIFSALTFMSTGLKCIHLIQKRVLPKCTKVTSNFKFTSNFLTQTGVKYLKLTNSNLIKNFLAILMYLVVLVILMYLVENKVTKKAYLSGSNKNKNNMNF